MKNHGLLAIWIMAIVVATVFLHAGCRPSDVEVVAPPPANDDDSTDDCGEPITAQIQFTNGCIRDGEIGADTPMFVDLWFGLAGGDLEQVYPGFDMAYRFPLVSCETYQWHIQWIESGRVVDSVSSVYAEADPFSGGVVQKEIYPPDGCGGGSADALQPLWDCIEVTHGDVDPLSAMVLCCEPNAGLLNIHEIAARCGER